MCLFHCDCNCCIAINGHHVPYVVLQPISIRMKSIGLLNRIDVNQSSLLKRSSFLLN